MHNESKSDIEAIQACIQGNHQAFERLVNKYQSLVCAITYSGTGSVDRSEELAQETFIMAWKNLAQLRDLSKFQAWLCRIARNAVQNWIRSRKRDIVAKATSLDAANQTAHRSDPDQAAIQKEQVTVVNQALHHIPENYRIPLILFYRENKSTQEVARLLGLSENATRQRISRARSLLKKQVAALVETTLAQTGPDKVFTASVMASLAGLTVKGTMATASAIHASVGHGGAGLATTLSGMAGKVALVAAGIAVITGGLFLHQHVTEEPVLPPSVSESQETIENQEISLSSQEAFPAVNDGDTIATASDDTQSVVASGTQDIVSADAEGAAQAEGTLSNVTELYEFKPRGVLSGLITDLQTGEPVQDALVEISNNGSSARTDEHGFYSIEKIFRPGNCTILVESNAYAGIAHSDDNPLVNLSQDKQVVKHFQLARACQVNLRVTDANGVGIKGARVAVTSLADNLKREIGHLSMPQRTDANGALLLGGIPPANTDYVISVWHDVTVRQEKLGNGIRLAFTQYDYAASQAVVRLTDTDVIESVEIVLEKGELVHGYAEYEDGVPATDIQIGAQPVWWHCNGGGDHYPVNADGTFALNHITPGTYDIKMLTTDPEGLPQSSRVIMQTQLPPAEGQPLVLHLPLPSPQSRASISGHFVFLEEERPHHVMVSAYSPNLGNKHVDVSIKPGSSLTQAFSLDGLEPGHYRLVFSGSGIESRTLENIAAPCADLEVNLYGINEQKLSLTGAVISAQSGNPIKAFRMRLQKKPTPGQENYVVTKRVLMFNDTDELPPEKSISVGLLSANAAPADQWIAFSGTDGRFDFESIESGTYQIQVMAQGYAPFLSEEINTRQREDLVLALIPGGTVSGKVVNQAGEPIHGAKVIPLSYARGNRARTQNTFVNENGACETQTGLFTLSSLPAGIESLKVTHPEYTFEIVEDIEVWENQVTADVEIVLTPGGTVEGVVYDELGVPLANQVLYVQDDDGYSSTASEMVGRLATAVTDSNGFYRAEHLPEQLCYINRADPARTMGVTRRTVMPMEGKTRTLDFGGEPIVSGAIRVDERLLAQRRIQLRTPGSSISALFKCFAMTDAQGNFAFRGVKPGTYVIYYETPNGQERWQKVTMLDVASTSLDLGVIGSADSRLLVRLLQSPSASPEAMIMLALTEGQGDDFFSSAKYFIQSPPNAGDPWIIPDIVAGIYTARLLRQDGVQFRREIILEPDQKPWEISWRLPEKTANLSGSLGESRQSFLLWQDTKEVVVNLMTDEQGQYALKNLPVGTYFLSTTLQKLYDLPSMGQVTLLAGQDQTFNPDLPVRQEVQPSSLVVQVIDGNGIIRDDVHLSLAGDLGDIGPCSSFEGNYVFLANCGEHTLHVVADGHQPVEKAVTLVPTEPGTKPQNIQIRLKGVR